jgi:phosphoglycerate dehydrogenase-like enzyme
MFTKIQLHILQALANQEHTLASLSRAIPYTKPSVAAQLLQLEKHGWIQRHQQSAKKISYSVINQHLFMQQLQASGEDTLQSVFQPTATPKTSRPLMVSGFALDFSPQQLQHIQASFNYVEYPEAAAQITPELFLLRYAQAEIAIISFAFSFLTPELIKQCPKLKHVIYIGKFAKEYIDPSIVTDRHIKWWDLSSDDLNYIRNSTSEFLLGTTLSLLRPTQQAEQDIKITGRAGAALREQYLGEEIWGKTVGFIGVENSPRVIAPVFRELGASLMFADPDQLRPDPFYYGVERFHSVADLFSSADIVIYSDNYYKATPRLEDFITDTMHTNYLLVLGEYPYTETFMKACRQQLLSGNLKGLHLDYWSARRFKETPSQRTQLLSEIMHFPNVHITPFIGPSSRQSVTRRNSFVIDILHTIQGDQA